MAMAAVEPVAMDRATLAIGWAMSPAAHTPGRLVAPRSSVAT